MSRLTEPSMSQLKEKSSDISSNSSGRSLNAVRSILKKEESKSKTKSSCLRFDDSSLSKVYIFDMEDPNSCMEVHALSSQDINVGLLDYPDLSPSEEGLKKIREAREKEFKIKRKKHHHNEFMVVKSVTAFDDDDLETSINALNLSQERT